MQTLYLIVFFIFGLLMGSFLTVVGSRIPKKENFVNSRSYCDKCHHQLSFLDLIPIVSYLCLGGRCRYCKAKIDDLSSFMELFTGILFALSYYVFGFSLDLLIALGIISMLIIISVTDINYLIIPDEVLIFFAGYFIIIYALQGGVVLALINIAYGLLLFFIMYMIMIIGNFIFKKETMGGGDVKMMFVFGLLVHPLLGLFVIFIASLLALPVSLIMYYSKKQRLVPFGPFLLISLAFIYFTGINVDMILDFVNSFSI